MNEDNAVKQEVSTVGQLRAQARYTTREVARRPLKALTISIWVALYGRNGAYYRRESDFMPSRLCGVLPVVDSYVLL